MYGAHAGNFSIVTVCIQTLIHVWLPPLSLQISTLIQDLQELHAHTPQEHVDYDTFQEIRDELNCIQKVSNTLFLSLLPFLHPSSPFLSAILSY